MGKRLPRYRYIYTLALFPLALVGLGIGCSPAEPAAFDDGSPDELKHVEETALRYLDERLASEGRTSHEHVQTSAVFVDDLAMAHVRVQQVERGVPVFGGEAIVHLHPDGALFEITDTRVQGLPSAIDTEPKLAPAVAVESALAGYDCPDCLTAPPEVDLWILQRPESSRAEARLSYRVQLERLDGSDRTSKPVLFIDAETGEELWRYDNLQAGSGKSYYSGTVTFSTINVGIFSYMQDPTRRLGAFTYNGTTSSTIAGTSGGDVFNYDNNLKAMVDAHYGATKVYDYFKTQHNRNGIDGNNGPGSLNAADGSGGLVASVTNYGVKINNAYWNGTRMVYGDGDGSLFSSLVTLDICGHEMTHGITDRSARLIYAGQSGALNESWSDVFGAMVERFARGESTNTWRIGEECFTPGIAGDALRFMDNPHAAFNGGVTPDDDPDHYTERYTGTNDNGGVHTNSGIANKAFYLLAKGGNHHKGGSMADVGAPSGIGPDKAAAIWYKALTAYMTSSTDFAGARAATLSAAKAIHGDQGVEYKAVAQAWLLVGIGPAAPPVACAHDVCVQGAALAIGCDACVAKVCASDSSCCKANWKAQCVDKAATMCGKCGVDECALNTDNCDAIATCIDTPASFKCMCPSLYNDVNGNGTSCKRHPSCKSLKAKQPNLASGMYPIDPDGPGGAAEYNAYCDMTTDGGGWTALFNEGTSFDRTQTGMAGVNCFNTTGCKSLAYSTVPITADLMLDVDDAPFTGASHKMRTRIKGVNPGLIGKTMHFLMNNAGDFWVEKLDNTNVLNTFAAGYDCGTWAEYTSLILCASTARLMINDNEFTDCGVQGSFAIGQYMHGNCAGWPNDPNYTGNNYWPDNFRIWVR